jgi:hypothetical protein
MGVPPVPVSSIFTIGFSKKNEGQPHIHHPLIDWIFPWKSTSINHPAIFRGTLW